MHTECIFINPVLTEMFQCTQLFLCKNSTFSKRQGRPSLFCLPSVVCQSMWWTACGECKCVKNVHIQ